MADENKNQQKEANFHFYLNTQGVRGRKGEKGDTGFSPTVTVSENTLNTYKLKVLTVDGEFETPNLRGSIIADGEGSYIRYDATTDKLYVSNPDIATDTTYGTVRLASEADIENLSEGSVMVVSDVAEFISTHLQAADDSISFSYDEDTGVITVKANVTVEPIEDFKVAEPLVMTDGADYEKDMVIVGGTIDEENLVFDGDWHPLFSVISDPVKFDLHGDFVLNGNEFTPSNYLSIPYQLGDIIGFAGNTGADIAAGHIREEDGQFIFTHLLRVDGLTESSIALAVKHVASKTPNSTNTTLNCIGSNPHSNSRITGKNFNDGACYFQINETEDGKMEVVFLRSTTSGFTAGVKTICELEQAVADGEALNRVFFGGTGDRLNPLTQFHIYRQPNVNLADLNSQADLAAFPDMVNFAFPDETRTIRLKYDNQTIVLDSQKRLSTSNLIAKKSDLNPLSTEITSLDDRVTALEDKPEPPTYELPIASSTTLGGVKIGDNITISEDGTISASGGGETGTTNYEELTNLPSINDVELKGNKSLIELNIEERFDTNKPLTIATSIEQPYAGISLNVPDQGKMQPNLYNRYAAWGSVNSDGSADMSCYVEFPYSTSLAVTGNFGKAPSGVQGLSQGFPALIGTKTNGKFFPKIWLGRTFYTIPNSVATENDTTYGPYIKPIGTTVNISGGMGDGVNNNLLMVFGYRVISDSQIQVQMGSLYSNDGGYTPITTINLPDSIKASDLNCIRLCCGRTSSTYGSYSNFNAFRYRTFDTDFTSSNIVNYFTGSSYVDMTNVLENRYLNLDIDDDTIKVNTDGKLYAVPQEAQPELPEGLTVSETDNSIDFTTSKAINLDGSMVSMPENAVVKLTDNTEKLILNQSNVEAGDNITIDQTATGIKINSTGGSGAEYTAGAGIKIDNNEISVDTQAAGEPTYNYVAVGDNITNENGILYYSNTSNNYARTTVPFHPSETDNWELMTKIKPQSTGGYFGQIGTNRENGIQFDVVNNSSGSGYRINYSYSTDGNSVQVDVNAADNSIQFGQWYYVQIKRENGVVTFSHGIDKENLTVDHTETIGVFYNANNKYSRLIGDQTYTNTAYMDLNETYFKVNGEVVWQGATSGEGNAVVASSEALGLVKVDGTTITATADGTISAVIPTASEEKYGIKGDYSTHYGILDCPNGLIDFNASNKQITVNQGMVLKCAGNGTAKTTIASGITHTITSPAGAITLFYANGNLLECGKVDYSTTQPEDNGVTNYQAWFNPDEVANPEQQWQFKSNDTGNIWRPVASATPLADIVVGNTGITSVSYIGYRVLDDDIIPQLSDIENLQETVETLQTAVGTAQDDITAITTRLDGITFKRMTQSEYNALETKDANTLYVITDVEQS